MPYTPQTVSNYNSSPPADNGSQVASNLVTWAGVKTKLTDPLNTLAAAINSALVTWSAEFRTLAYRTVGDYLTDSNPQIDVNIAALGAALGPYVPAGFTVGRAYEEYTTNADCTTQIPVDDTIPQNTEGTQIITKAYAAASATNRVRLRFQGQFICDTATGCTVAIFRSDSANAIAAQITDIVDVSTRNTWALEVEIVPGTTSSITYTVRVGPGAAATLRLNGNGGGRLFGGASRATLVIEEIKAS